MALVNWHIITKAEFIAARDAEEGSTLSDNSLYFISDTHELFKGENSFTEAVRFYTGEKPTTPAVGVVYLESTTLAGSVYNGTSWTDVIKPVQASLTASDTTNPVSGKAVADYVTSKISEVTGGSAIIKDIEYSSTTHQMTVTKGDDSTEQITLDGLGVALNYVTKTGVLTMVDASGAQLGTPINLALERFVQSASYDDEAKTITLVFNDGEDPVVINVADLVDTYTVADTSTVDMTLTGNEIKADVKISADAGNQISAKANGLFVAATDVSGKMDKVTAEDANEVIIAGADGNASASGKKIGAATLNASPNADTLATEAAVEAIRAALQTNIDGKMSNVATGHADEILVANASGAATLSGKKVGGATLAGTTDANTLATEAAVEAKITDYAVAKTAIVVQGQLAADVASASDTEVPSEKALVDALTWKTTV